jgi:ribosomal subunit interface protein
MQVQVSGKHVEVGDALRSRIIDELTQGIGKYFERGGDADVVVTKEGHLFRVDCNILLASGQQLVSHGYGGDAHGAFDGMLGRIEKRIRRYKRKLKNHHVSNGKSGQETAPITVLRAPNDHDDDGFGDDFGEESHAPPTGLVIAETESPIRTMTVGMAVMELDLSNYPVILFRNAAHGGLSVVYRRPDGNFGWIDPQRTGGNGEA